MIAGYADVEVAGRNCMRYKKQDGGLIVRLVERPAVERTGIVAFRHIGGGGVVAAALVTRPCRCNPGLNRTSMLHWRCDLSFDTGSVTDCVGVEMRRVQRTEVSVPDPESGGRERRQANVLELSLW